MEVKLGRWWDKFDLRVPNRDSFIISYIHVHLLQCFYIRILLLICSVNIGLLNMVDLLLFMVVLIKNHCLYQLSLV